MNTQSVKQKFAIINVGGTFRVHSANCADVSKDWKKVNSFPEEKPDITEAENAEAAIEQVKQEFYESAGGTGDYKLDTDMDHEPRSFAEQYFEVLPCAIRKGVS